MHVSTRWLADYVDLPPAAELASMLSLSGLEVGSARTVGVEPIAGVRMEDPGPVWDREKIVIGKVVSVGRHPDADKLKLPRVAFGNGREMTLVTGAPNIAPGDSGQWCVLALSGAKVIDGHSKEKVLKELKPTVIRGVPSEAMLCSAYELGLSEDHEGLLFLDPGTAPEGAPAAEALGDVVLEIDILPNMARCLALTGLAREVAALTGGRVREPDSSLPPGAGACPVKVSIEAPDACRRYMGLVVEGFPGGVSTERVRRLLAQSGMRPISAAVDITNFVMLEQGQPLHAFDLDKLEARAAGKPVEITVRYARAGETLTTLDGADRILSADMLVIADAAGPVALAGVMGGAATEVDSNTRRIFLESAHFDAVAIRRASRAFNLFSEASTRYTRGVSPVLAARGMGRAARLFLAGGASSVSAAADCHPAPEAPREVRYDWAAARRLAGCEIPAERVRAIVSALEFHVVSEDANGLTLRLPWHRLDVQEGLPDIVEDVVRLYGYGNLAPRLPAEAPPPPRANARQRFEDGLKDLLAGMGLREVISYALTSPAAERVILGGEADGPAVALANPISPERAIMRRSVLAGLAASAQANAARGDAVRVFELGTAFWPRQGERFPSEARRLAIAMSGSRHAESVHGGASGAMDFFDLKGVVEGMLAGLRVLGAAFVAGAHPALHPGKQARVVGPGGEELGFLGELHPRAAVALGGTPSRIHLAEFDAGWLEKLSSQSFRARAIPRFPAARRDLAVVVPEACPAADVEALLREAGTPLLETARLFDLYRGDPLGEGFKSLAYALDYQASDRTLTDKEVEQAHSRIETRLRAKLGARIRGKDIA